MRVALLIPCHRGAAFLPGLMASARAQTVPFTEIACYVNGIDDGAAAIAREAGALVVVDPEQRRPATARNRLLEATACDWVHFHDADDLLAPTFVERMTETAKGGHDPVLCAMKVVERLSGHYLNTVRYDELPNAPDPVAWLIRNNGFGIIGLYPTELLRSIGGFDTLLRGNEDPDLHVRLAQRGTRFRICSEPLVTNLVRADSFSKTNWTVCLADRVFCLGRYATADTPKARLTMIGVEALSTAEALLEAGDRSTARAAIDLAKHCGVTSVDSPRWWARAFSRAVGPELVFRMRRWKRALAA